MSGGKFGCNLQKGFSAYTDLFFFLVQTEQVIGGTIQNLHNVGKGFQTDNSGSAFDMTNEGGAASDQFGKLFLRKMLFFSQLPDLFPMSA